LEPVLKGGFSTSGRGGRLAEGAEDSQQMFDSNDDMHIDIIQDKDKDTNSTIEMQRSITFLNTCEMNKSNKYGPR
jgi:hypothetical protein